MTYLNNMENKYDTIKKLSDSRSDAVMAIRLIGSVLNNIEGLDDHYQRYDPTFNGIRVVEGNHKVFSSALLPEPHRTNFLRGCQELIMDIKADIENEISSLV